MMKGCLCESHVGYVQNALSLKRLGQGQGGSPYAQMPQGQACSFNHFLSAHAFLIVSESWG